MPPLERHHIAQLSARLADVADPADPQALLGLLRLLFETGRRDLPLGRLFEGHVDALQIVTRYGSSDQAVAARQAARAGAVFGVWNADLHGDPLRWDGERIAGGKAFASGAGVISHALVSVDAEAGRQLLLIDLECTPPAIDRTWWRVTGMQRSETHIVRWSDQVLPPASLVGKPGDYVREPWFSGGALRFTAVQAGGIAALVDHVRDHLSAHDRADDPQQAARLAGLYRAAQGACDAVACAALHWDEENTAATLAYVASARVAVYEAGERALSTLR